MTTPAIQYDFTGKVVVITGGSRGLGHAMGLGFAAAGANLAIASRKPDACEATVKEIRALGGDGTVAYAKEYGPKVRVNCIICGPFHTDVSKGWSRTADFTRRARETFPLQRAGEPHEVVGAALYFASPAASFTTGTTLTIDGGALQPIVRTIYE